MLEGDNWTCITKDDWGDKIPNTRDILLTELINYTVTDGRCPLSKLHYALL
jgi:hypothetical protein